MHLFELVSTPAFSNQPPLEVCEPWAGLSGRQFVGHLSTPLDLLLLGDEEGGGRLRAEESCQHLLPSARWALNSGEHLCYVVGLAFCPAQGSVDWDFTCTNTQGQPRTSDRGLP